MTRDNGTVSEKEAIDQKTQKDKAGLPGAVMISDAFFPFRDGVDVGLRQGITGVVQPGGSLRDYRSDRSLQPGRGRHGLHRPAGL